MVLTVSSRNAVPRPSRGSGGEPRLEALSGWPVGLHHLFREYRDEACATYGPFIANLLRPLPRAVALGLLHGYVAVLRGAPVGLLTCNVHRGVARVGFLHVAREQRRGGLEERLLSAFVRSLGEQSQRPASVVSEAMVVSHEDPDALFGGQGFVVVPRWIMRARIGPSGWRRRAHSGGAAAGLDGPQHVVRGWRAGDLRGCAEVLSDANTGSTDGLIYPELLDKDRALAAVQGILAGSFGRFLRRATSVAEVGDAAGARTGPQTCGVSLCCRSAPAEAFLVELAVRRSWQRRGLGTVLLERSMSQLSVSGLRAVVLGVTRSNDAATSLYGSHGFEVAAGFSSYYLPERKGD